MTHLPRPELPFAARLIVAPFLAIALLSTFTGAATAHVQREDGQDQRSKTPTPAKPDPDSADCAYDYGWNAAADSYATAVVAYVSLGWAPQGATRTPIDNHWWLDVETANSWRDDTSLNVAALQGAVDYLTSVDVASVGIYSSPRMWSQVAGGALDFADLSSWVAGASTLKGARNAC